MAAFEDRTQAGRRLAEELSDYEGRDDVLVLALPRGGVPVAYQIAEKLDVPMDIFLVRKLGAPANPELAMGAIASGGVRVMNDDVVSTLRVSEAQIQQVAEREQAELERREQAYRGDRPRPEVEGKVVILVDDGLATGATMRAAVRALRSRGPQRIVVAVGTAPPDTVEQMEQSVDELVCLVTPRPFFGVGGSYRDFSQTTDEEVKRLLDEAPRPS
ncbi:MAG: phosphoribosyltransferase [Candidatus Brocadiia bacterium]